MVSLHSVPFCFVVVVAAAFAYPSVPVNQGKFFSAIFLTTKLLFVRNTIRICGTQVSSAIVSHIEISSSGENSKWPSIWRQIIFQMKTLHWHCSPLRIRLIFEREWDSERHRNLLFFDHITALNNLHKALFQKEEKIDYFFPNPVYTYCIYNGNWQLLANLMNRNRHFFVIRAVL